MSRLTDTEKAAQARLFRQPFDPADYHLGEGTPWQKCERAQDFVDNAMRARVVRAAAKLGLSIADCGWYHYMGGQDRYACLHVGTKNRRGDWILAKVETLSRLVTALVGSASEEEDAAADVEAEGQHAAPMQRKAQLSFAWWAVALLLALLVLQAAPALPAASRIAAMVQPFHDAAPAVAQRKHADATSVTAGWPPALGQLEAQASLEDAVALLSLNATNELSSMADKVHRTAWASKAALDKTFAAQDAAVRQDVAAQLADISAAVLAGQPVLVQPAATVMQYGNSTLEGLAANYTASAARLDEEIIRISRVMRALAAQRDLQERGVAAAATSQ